MGRTCAGPDGLAGLGAESKCHDGCFLRLRGGWTQVRKLHDDPAPTSLLPLKTPDLRQ